MDGDRAHAVFSDPPYNVRIDGNVSGLGTVKHREFAMASGEMTEEEFTGFLTKAFSLFSCNSVDGSLHFVCMDWRHLAEMLAAGRATYTEFMNLCVWAKDNAGMGPSTEASTNLFSSLRKAVRSTATTFNWGSSAATAPTCGGTRARVRFRVQETKETFSQCIRR